MDSLTQVSKNLMTAIAAANSLTRIEADSWLLSKETRL